MGKGTSFWVNNIHLKFSTNSQMHYSNHLWSNFSLSNSLISHNTSVTVWLRVLFLFTALWVFNIQLFAQAVTIENVSIPINYVDDASLLSEMQVNNRLQNQSEIQVSTNILDLSGRNLLQINSFHIVQPGVSNLSSPISIEVTNTSSLLHNYMKESGMVPQARLSLCVEVKDAAGASDRMCRDQNQLRNFNLFLQYPYDKEVINTLRPSLFWNFIGSTKDVTYRVVLKNANQEISEMDNNLFGPTVFSSSQIPDQFIDFPVNIPDLEVGKTYQWQVEALLGDMSLGETEMWTFSIEEPQDTDDIPFSRSFIDYTEIGTEPTYYLLGTMKIKLVETQKSGKLKVVVHKQNTKQAKAKSLGKKEFDIEIGENFYTIDLSEEFNLKHNKSYIAQVSKGKKEIQTVHFVYFNPKYLKQSKSE